MSAVDAVAVTAGERRGIGGRFVRSELRMVFGRRRNQVVLGVLAIVPILIAIAVKVSAPKAGEGPAFIGQITQNGIFVAFTALTVIIPIFLPLAVAIVSGDSVAGEAGAGTLRYLLVVPVSRTRLLAVKYAVAVLFECAGVFLVAAVGVIIGVILFPGRQVTLLSGTTVGVGEALARLAASALYVALAMAAMAAIGLWISTLVESSVPAMAATAGVAVVAQVLANVPQLHSIWPYLLNHWWLRFGDLLRDPIDTSGVWQGLGVSLAYVAIFGSLAWARFTTKDVSS